MIILGLTGSIAMGKSETAKLFAAEGVPVFDSDAEVHRQYAVGGQAAARVAAQWPEVMSGGAVDRDKLSRLVLKEPAKLKLLESLVHPIIRQEQERFLDCHRHAGTPIVLLDIPLLFETGRGGEVDRIVVVSAPPEIQKARALTRRGMTEEKLNQILSRQWPDEKKRMHADFVVDSSQSLDHARSQVRIIIAELRDRRDSPDVA
jgi:dephospho-CoA kinase